MSGNSTNQKLPPVSDSYLAAPQGFLAATAAKSLFVFCDEHLAAAGEYLLMKDGINERPAWVRTGSQKVFLYWTPRGGGRWIFATEAADKASDSTPGLLLRNMQMALNLLPEEVMQSKWSKDDWGPTSTFFKISFVRG